MNPNKPTSFWNLFFSRFFWSRGNQNKGCKNYIVTFIEHHSWYICTYLLRSPQQGRPDQTNAIKVKKNTFIGRKSNRILKIECVPSSLNLSSCALGRSLSEMFSQIIFLAWAQAPFIWLDSGSERWSERGELYMPSTRFWAARERNTGVQYMQKSIYGPKHSQIN